MKSEFYQEAMFRSTQREILSKEFHFLLLSILRENSHTIWGLKECFWKLTQFDLFELFAGRIFSWQGILWGKRNISKNAAWRFGSQHNIFIFRKTYIFLYYNRWSSMSVFFQFVLEPFERCLYKITPSIPFQNSLIPEYFFAGKVLGIQHSKK